MPVGPFDEEFLEQRAGEKEDGQDEGIKNGGDKGVQDWPVA